MGGKLGGWVKNEGIKEDRLAVTEWSQRCKMQHREQGRRYLITMCGPGGNQTS